MKLTPPNGLCYSSCSQILVYVCSIASVSFLFPLEFLQYFFYDWIMQTKLLKWCDPDCTRLPILQLFKMDAIKLKEHSRTHQEIIGNPQCGMQLTHRVPWIDIPQPISLQSEHPVAEWWTDQVVGGHPLPFVEWSFAPEDSVRYIRCYATAHSTFGRTVCKHLNVDHYTTPSFQSCEWGANEDDCIATETDVKVKHFICAYIRMLSYLQMKKNKALLKVRQSMKSTFSMRRSWIICRDLRLCSLASAIVCFWAQFSSSSSEIRRCKLSTRLIDDPGTAAPCWSGTVGVSTAGADEVPVSGSVCTEVLQQITQLPEAGPFCGTASLELSLGLVTQLLLPPRTGDSICRGAYTTASDLILCSFWSSSLLCASKPVWGA